MLSPGAYGRWELSVRSIWAKNRRQINQLTGSLTITLNLLAQRWLKKTLTKPNKNVIRHKYLGRIVPNSHFCPYNSHLKCPVLRDICPFQDAVFIEDMRYFYTSNRGLKSLPLQPRVVSESGQVLGNYQLIKLLDISNLFDGFVILDWLGTVLDAPIDKIKMTKVKCREIRRAHKKWFRNLAPGGHRIVRVHR